MGFSTMSTASTASNLFTIIHSSHSHPKFNRVSFFLPLPDNVPSSSRSVSCYAATKPPSRPVKKRSTSNSSKKKKSNNRTIVKEDVEIVEDRGMSSHSQFDSFQSLPLPKPPAGFILDEQGRVVMASNKRIATIVDFTNNLPLECIIRRVFRNSKGDECMLLCPLDTPVQILKSTNVEGWSAVSDDEVEVILPTVAYALAKIHMHLVHSGFCYTARGGFCYAEDEIFELQSGQSAQHFGDTKNYLKILSPNPDSNDGQGIDGVPTEGIEITCFHLDGSHYMIYTPSDPLIFVAVKDDKGVLQIADDEIAEDPAIVSAIDEETEFNALVEEEAALIESLLGET